MCPLSHLQNVIWKIPHVAADGEMRATCKNSISLFVSNIPNYFTKIEIFALFNKVGRIVDSYITTEKSSDSKWGLLSPVPLLKWKQIGRLDLVNRSF